MKSSLEIIEMLEDFLEHREPSVNNGFALVSKEDYVKLGQIIDEVIEAKWEPDPDGDYPINFCIINRHQREPMHYRAVTYRHVDKEQNLRDIMVNLSTAARDVTLSLDLDRIDERFKGKE